MEPEAEHVESEAPDDGCTVAVLFGRAVRIARSQFQDLHGYLYAILWSRFVVREATAGQVQFTDEGEVQATVEQLVKNGQCVLNVSLFPDRGYGRVESGRVRLKKNETVWLSRKDPYEDGHAHALKVDRVHMGIIYFRADSRYPEDAAEGVWRLDLGTNEVQLDSQLHCIKKSRRVSKVPCTRLL